MAAQPAPTLAGQSPQAPLEPLGNGAVGPDLLACSAPNCDGGTWTYFDPAVAIGYDFALSPTEPSETSVGVTEIRVSTDVGDGDYQFYLRDVSGDWIDMAPIEANPDGLAADDFDVVALLAGLTAAEDQEFGITDPADGVTQFSIRGLDPNAGLDPNDPQDFVTGLEFSSAFQGDVLITPLELDVGTDVDSSGATFAEALPEPPSLALFAAGLLALVLRGRRRTPPRRRREA